MALNVTRKIEEARRATVQPTQADAAVARQGFVSGVPLGGASETNQGAAGSIGSLDRRSFMQQLLQSYLACPWSSACVDIIARTATAGGVDCVPNKWTGDLGKVPQAPPPVKEVQQLLQYVNPYEDARQLFRTIITDLLIYGDSFTEVVYFMGKPVALYSLDPATMLVKSDEHGNVTGFCQQMDTGLTADFDPWEVIHVKLDDPSSGLYGVSPTQKAILPITIWLFTAALVKETMKRGDPLRLWVDWPLALPTSEMQRFQQQYQVRNLGPKNIGNLFETKGKAEVKELAVNQIDRWMSTLDQESATIRSTYGVPASKVGASVGTVSPSATSTDDRVFNINTVGPLAELVLEKFTFRILAQCYGVDDWHLRFGDVDWRDDLAVEQIMDMRVRSGRLTLNAARAIIGQPPVPGGDDAVLVDRTNLVIWDQLRDLTNANLSAVKAKGTPPPGGPTQKVGASTPRTPNTPKARPVSNKSGGQNPAESLREQWQEYQARKMD